MRAPTTFHLYKTSHLDFAPFSIPSGLSVELLLLCGNVSGMWTKTIWIYLLQNVMERLWKMTYFRWDLFVIFLSQNVSNYRNIFKKNIKIVVFDLLNYLWCHFYYFVSNSIFFNAHRISGSRKTLKMLQGGQKLTSKYEWAFRCI